MRKLQNASLLLVILCALALAAQELVYFHRLGHPVGLGLSLELVASESTDVLGVKGNARIYDAVLTNVGLLPAALTVCEYQDGGNGGKPALMINYLVERRTSPSDQWKAVPEWDGYGSRLFCVPSFEITGAHLIKHRVWPGRALRVTEVIPAQSGFTAGDEGRLTVFLHADGSPRNSISSASFAVEKR